jgi:phytoene synthase
MRDVRVDAVRDRIYIPQDEMVRFGYSEAELLQGAYTPAFLELMRFAGTRAHLYFQNAQQLLAAEDRRSLFAAEIMGAIYYRLLESIEASGYRVFDRVITLPTTYKLWIALATWARSRHGALRSR